MVNDVLFSVGGCEILNNTIYKLRFKKDYSVPEEMQKQGYSKYPGTTSTVKCPVYGEIYDTGFEESSRQYFNVEDKNIKKEVTQRRKNVLLPFLKMKGLTEDSFKPSSFGDWDDYRVSLDETRIFRTQDINDRMALYVCLIGRSIVPMGKEDTDFYYEGAKYVLQTTVDNLKRTTDSMKNKTRATASFYNLIENDKETLVDVLVYMGCKELRNGNVDEAVLYHYLDNFILKTVAKTEDFIESSVRVEDESGKEEIKLYRLISNAIRKKNKNFAKDGNDIIYKGESLGKSLKDVANMLSTNENYENVKDEIILDLD